MGHPPIFLAMWVIEGRLTMDQATWIWSSVQGQEIPRTVEGLVRHFEALIDLAKREFPE